MTTGRQTLLLVLFAVAASGSVLTAIGLRLHRSGPAEDLDQGHRRFMQLVADGRETEALQLGDSLFHALVQEQPDGPALVLLAQRLDAAEQVRALLADRAQPTQAVLIEGIAGLEDLDVPAPVAQSQDGRDLLLPSARGLYWTHLGTFTAEPSSPGVTERQMAFCRQYFELRMQDAVMEIGRQILVTSPDSLEQVCYAGVLPLLCLYGREDAWDQMEPVLALFGPQRLAVLSMFALLQAERPEAAVAIARYRARAMGMGFSATAWASHAADACVAGHRPDLAERLLRTVLAGVQDPDGVAELRLKIAEAYARCGDCAAAARACEAITTELPDTSLHGKVIAMYLGYLAREDDANQVIAVTASILDDPRCRSHLAQILYLRWWALRKAARPEQAADTAQRLLEQYPDNPCVAPVLLERATDALAHQEYDNCRELLTTLTRDFGGTESARRAHDILARITSRTME